MVAKSVVAPRMRGEKMNFESIIEKNGDEFTAQTCNGTAKWRGTGWNGDEYEELNDKRPQLTPRPTRPPGRSNRTGE